MIEIEVCRYPFYGSTLQDKMSEEISARVNEGWDISRTHTDKLHLVVVYVRAKT